MNKHNPRVLILGGGFGGLRAAQALAGSDIEVLLVDENNYHLFQPLLYQVASAGLEPEQVAYPLRAILRNKANVRFHMSRVIEIQLDPKLVTTDRGVLEYDFLVVALGAQNRTWGIPGLDKYSLPIKRLPDAIAIRNHVLMAFEQASLESNVELQPSWLRFVVAGGGPTGVEMVGAFAELMEHVMRKDFSELDFTQVEIHLLEGRDTLLAGFPEDLQQAAIKTLEHKGVEVHLGTSVLGFDGEEISLSGGAALGSHTLIWAAGVEGRDVLSTMAVKQSTDNRVLVAQTLSIPEAPDVYVIGDAAYLEIDGSPLPMMAPVAVQMADHAVANIKRKIAGQAVEPFRYRNPGRLATIGRNSAVAEVGGIRFRGFPAWLVWLGVHLMQLVGYRNRLMVLINWAWEYIFYDRAVRLILNVEESHGGETTDITGR